MIQCLSICLLHFALQPQHVVILFLWAQQEGGVDQWQRSGHPTCVAPQCGLLQDVLIQTVGRCLFCFITGVISVSWYPPGLADSEGRDVDSVIPLLLDAADNQKLKVFC